MARDRSVVPTAPVPNSLVASAARVDMGSIDYLKYSRSSAGWQTKAWEMYDTVGEFRYACDWVGSMLAKALLMAAEETPDGPKPITDGRPAEYMQRLYGNTEGQSEMLRQMGIHFTVAGECWLFAWDSGSTSRWMVAASTEVSSRRIGDDRAWYVARERVGGTDVGPVVAIRLWRPHPQRPMEANSPARAVLPILGEIRLLTEHVSAQVQSRLAGAGILLLPAEMTLPAAAPGGSGEDPPRVAAASTATAFMSMLTEAMATAIRDRGDASALVPIVVTAPADQIPTARHLTFWTDLDQHAVDLRNEAIRRLALGLDMPPEVLTGVGADNHWNAWLADESAIKGHTEPLLKIITSSLSEGYLRPALTPGEDEEPLPNIDRIVVRADTSQMRLRPNRSREAFELYDRAELSGSALRRETGFSPDDALDEGGVQEWFTRKVAMGQTTPDLVAAALRLLGVDAARLTAQVNDDHEARPTPSLLRHPERNPPELEAGLLEASNQIVIRALERAGNRMRQRTGARVPGATALSTYMHLDVKPADMAFYLEDAWTHVGEVARRHKVRPEWLTAALDFYCRARMTDKRKHDVSLLGAYLSACIRDINADEWRAA